jgi:hypothetical protein
MSKKVAFMVMALLAGALMVPDHKKAAATRRHTRCTDGSILPWR